MIMATMTITATINQLIDSAMTTKKGVNTRLAWRRSCKVKKTCNDLIEKACIAVGRLGIDYDNQAAVIAKRESGELPEQSQPIWNGKGEWLIFPYLIKHTDTNQLYLRLYSGTSSTAKASVQYYRNDQAVTFESVENDLLASEKGEKTGDCFCVKIEDMTQIGMVGEPESELQTA